MSPIDPATLGSDTPRTLDGRTYPDHLRPFESYDDEFRPLVAALQPVTVNALSSAVGNARSRAALDLWLKSAEWRGLIERRHDERVRGPRTYVLGPMASE